MMPLSQSLIWLFNRNKVLFRAFEKVFRKRRYFAFALALSFVTLSFFILFPNFTLIQNVVGAKASVSTKGFVISSLLGSITTNFTLLSATYTVLIALLFGVNGAMVAYYFNRRVRALRHSKLGTATSIGGIVSGLFGVGCAACGSIFIGPFLSLVGAGGVVAWFPFGGQEFGIIGVLLLLISVYVVAQRIQDSLTCAVGSAPQR